MFKLFTSRPLFLKKLSPIIFILVILLFFITPVIAGEDQNFKSDKSILKVKSQSVNPLDDKNQSEIIRIYSTAWKYILPLSLILSLIMVHFLIKQTANISILNQMDRPLFLIFIELVPFINAFIYFLLYLIFESKELISEVMSISIDNLSILENSNIVIIGAMILLFYFVNLFNLIYFKYINMYWKPQFTITLIPFLFLLIIFLYTCFGELIILLLPVIFVIALGSPIISLIMLVKQIRGYVYGEPIEE